VKIFYAFSASNYKHYKANRRSIDGMSHKNHSAGGGFAPPASWIATQQSGGRRTPKACRSPL